MIKGEYLPETGRYLLRVEIGTKEEDLKSEWERVAYRMLSSGEFDEVLSSLPWNYGACRYIMGTKVGKIVKYSLAVEP